MHYMEKFRVYSYEVDMTNKATLQTICQYLQEAASNHADKLGFGMTWLLSNKRTWMLSRLMVKMFSYPRVGDEIVIKTWPSGADRLFILRDFLILNREGEILGTAVSSWVYMNMETRRPVHPSSGEIPFIPEVTERAIEENPGKVKASEKPEEIVAFQVRYNDLDMNNHVNNIKYIEWILECMDPEFRKTHIPSEITINFLAEAIYGHGVSAHLARSETSFIHTIISNEKDICRAETLWKSLEQPLEYHPGKKTGEIHAIKSIIDK